MTRTVAFPFLTLPDSEINAEPWSICVNGGESIPAAEFIADWDYATQIELTRNVNVSFEGAAASLGIPPRDLELALLVEVGTGAGRFPRTVLICERFPISASSGSIQVKLAPDSAKLSSFIFLTTTLVLTAPPAASGNLSPKLTNSKLWSERFMTRLDGDEPRFPIEIASFSSLFGNLPESRAPWYVSWNPGDWNRDFHGAVRLYLNKEFPEFVERLQSGDAFLLQSISVDIVGQILEKLVIEEDAQEIIANAPAGSLGAQAGSWIRLAWPGAPIHTLKQKAESQPGRFRACIWAIAEQQDEL
ncbi:hypothetical protein [Marinobacter sp. ANT_B65]|uniref:hypothetical protein n=1 Tax=Marinobacter sp. ANT_B65 TaxID=2039467 RepID=UPI000BBEF146|nr:hypothetical protein [Marinobacter sp. ANT_B65]PCM45389.1 hypothetical protein CPA50_05115 [Marinobacter sp. ANT_B65]